jgi:hypothetical protein
LENCQKASQLVPAGTRRVHHLRVWDNVRSKEIPLGRAIGSTSMVPPAASMRRMHPVLTKGSTLVVIFTTKKIKKKFKKLKKNGTLVIREKKRNCDYEFKREVSIYRKYRRIALPAFFILDTDG